MLIYNEKSIKPDKSASLQEIFQQRWYRDKWLSAEISAERNFEGGCKRKSFAIRWREW